jgi:hypothetical protein
MCVPWTDFDADDVPVYACTCCVAGTCPAAVLQLLVYSNGWRRNFCQSSRWDQRLLGVA